MLSWKQPASRPDETRHRLGPLIENFKTILSGIQLQLAAIDPSLTPEYLMPFSYQSLAVRNELDNNSVLKSKLRAVQTFRFTETDKLVNDVLLEHLGSQTIPSDTLDTPPYCRQGDDWNDFRSSMTCANACFRMLFGGITGWTPREEVIAESYIATSGSSVVADTEYQKLFKTEVFKEVSDKTVNVVEITGADFRVINFVASRTKERMPNAQVYAIASLASATASRDIWHASVILEATDTHVICHDPSRVNGSPYKQIPRDVFVARWAGALNRVQLFIAT